MNFFIGVDGGGSKTKCILTDENFKILAAAKGGASNPLIVGPEKSARLIHSLISEVIKKSGVKIVGAAVIGLAGAGRKKNAADVKRALNRIETGGEFSVKKIIITSDVTIFAEGALSGKSGALIIAGTGSIVVGIDKKGNFYRAGGYGKLIGDEGSGYSIGKKGLNAVAKYFDGRLPNSILIKMMMKKFAVPDRDSLILKVYSEKIKAASVAPLIIDAAQKGDKTARKILDEELNELILKIDPVIKKIREKKINLCLSGGLLATENYYSKRFKKRIGQKYKNINIAGSVHPPEMGAAIMAAKKNKTEIG